MAAISIKTGMFLLLGILTISSAQAKVTPINEYNMTITDDGKQALNQSCASYGWFDSIQTNAICTLQTLMDGTKCYDCHCDSKYKYTCSGTGITVSGGACSIGGSDKYTACACAEGYIKEAEFTPNLTSISYPQPSTGDDGTKCYKKSAFACKGGYNKFTSHPDSPYVTYTTQSPFSDKSLQCVTGYSKTGNRYYESRPSNTDCLEMSSINLSLLPTPKNLYYFTGSCSSSTGCTTTKKDCVSYNSQKGTTKTGGSVTCNKISGCQSGLVGSYICGTTAASSSYFTSEKVTDGTTTCYKVSGCKTGSGYEQAYIGTSPAADYTTKSGSNYTYTVQKYTAGSASLVCRTPSGCRTGYYNVACEGGCWNGWLSLWAQ